MLTTHQPTQLELFPTSAYGDSPHFDLMQGASTLFGDWSTIREWQRRGAPEQLEMFPTTVRLTKIVPARNQWRFYLMQVLPTLFGDWALVREWGRIGAPGRVMMELHRGAGEAINALAQLQRRKQHRGYQTCH
jgi:predicted DNA-binding WGR domain protein